MEQLIEAAGLSKASALAQSFREVLKNAIKFALDIYRKATIAYNSANGGSAFIDPEADIPLMTWGPITVHHSDLVELYSFDPDILKEDTAIFEWIGLKKGDGAILARGRSSGERAKVLIDYALCAICVYSGGAFGNNTPVTETQTVTVGKPADLDILITGLLSGTDGSVIVDGPNGYTSGVLTASTTLSDLETGDYHITAINVVDGTGYEYVPEPVDTTVTLEEEDNATVEIKYEAKYGSLLVTVSGLPDGVDADINLTGPDVNIHIVTDTLIDSLVPGDYLVEAYEVNSLSPDPASQTVEVIGRQTSTAAVNYGGGVTMKVLTGDPYKQIRPMVRYPYNYLAEAHWSVGGNPYSEFEQDYYYHGGSGPSPEPAYVCKAGDTLVGGSSYGTVSTSATTSAASCEATMSVSSIDDKSMRISYSGSSNADILGTDDATATASTYIETWGWVVLVIENKSTNNYGLWYIYDFSATGQFSYPTPLPGYSARFTLGYDAQTSCDVLGIPDYYSYSKVFSLDGELNNTTNLQGEEQFLYIPPGITFVQLYTELRSAGSSSTRFGYNYNFSATFNGSVTLELRP